MKKYIIAFLVFGLGLSASAWSASAVNTLSIGIVDMQTLFEKAPQGKVALARAKAAVEADAKQKSAALQKQREQLQQQLADFKRNQKVMSDAEKAKKQKEIMGESDALQKSLLQLKQEAMTKEQAVIQAFSSKADQVIAQVAKADQLNLVLRKVAVAYASGEKDITPDVIAAMKKA